MSKFSKTEFYLDVARGLIPKHFIVHKFGAGSITTALAPVTQTNAYQTPTAAVALELVSDNVADAQNGVGAREITVTGLDANWDELIQVVSTHATDGTIAVSIPTSLIRVYRWFVSSTGTYASSTAGSHVGNLSVQVSGGGTVWDTIPALPFPAGQSQIGAYTIPTGFTGYLVGKLVYTDTGKTADIYFFQRNNADDVSTPFSGAMRIVEREIGIQGGFDHHMILPKNGFVGPCDLGFMGKVTSGTADISVEFEILLIQD